MRILPYKNEYCETVAKLFYETIHSVNLKDYSSEQLSAWANSADSLKSRRDDLLNQHTLIAEINGAIVGFGSIDKSGYLDLLFTHKDFQNRGVATALCNELEKGYAEIKTFSSGTAKPFFTNRGYEVIKEQEVKRLGVKLKNFEMIKHNLTR
ncbi:MAG: GNAT family N-acetyltransferase [Candidatus Coproplasma sp.]